jgi:hypothetical protein
VDLEDVADELYGLPPEEFIAARREREAQARAAGDRALAKEIAALGKPSTAAWVCNLLAREQRAEVDGLVELGGMLREAQENLAGDELRELDVQRRRLVAALARQGRALAYQHGHPVTTAVADQVEETLRAALADPEAAEELGAGRLTTALSYSGLGTGARPDLRVVAPRERPEKPAPARKRTAVRDGDADSRRRERAEAERRAAEERRRRELEQARAALDEATSAAEEASAAADAERERAEELRERESALEARIEELTDQLNRARDEHTRLGHDRARAERREQAAARRAADAERARDHARQHLEQVEKR